jgi:hypothetical protein
MNQFNNTLAAKEHKAFISLSRAEEMDALFR